MCTTVFAEEIPTDFEVSTKTEIADAFAKVNSITGKSDTVYTIKLLNDILDVDVALGLTAPVTLKVDLNNFELKSTHKLNSDAKTYITNCGFLCNQ